MSTNINEKMSNYLQNTCYSGATPSTNLTTNISRFLKDSTKWVGLTNATARLKKLMSDAASS